MVRKTSGRKLHTTSIDFGNNALNNASLPVWQTEQNCEYTWKAGLNTDAYLPHQNPCLRTPRSLKKGYVQYAEYELMENQFLSSKEVQDELTQRLLAAEVALQDMASGGRDIATRMKMEHSATITAKQRADDLAVTLHALLARVEDSSIAVAQLARLEQPLMKTPAGSLFPVSQRISAMEQQLSTLVSAVSQMQAQQQHLELQQAKQSYIQEPKKNRHQTQQLEVMPCTTRRLKNGIKEKVEIAPPLQNLNGANQIFWKP